MICLLPWQPWLFQTCRVASYNHGWLFPKIQFQIQHNKITASGITMKKAAKVVFWCHFLLCCHSNGLIFQYHPTHFYHWCFFPMWHSNRFIYIVSNGLISNKNCNLCSFSINHCLGCYGNKIKIRRLKMPYPDSPCLVL